MYILKGEVKQAAPIQRPGTSMSARSEVDSSEKRTVSIVTLQTRDKEAVASGKADTQVVAYPESYEARLIRELNMRKARHDVNMPRLHINKSLSIKSLDTPLAASHLGPKIYSTKELKKNSYLIRKYSYKQYSTENNIGKLLQAYSLV